MNLENTTRSEDDLACAAGILRAVMWSLALYAAGLVAYMVIA